MAPGVYTGERNKNLDFATRLITVRCTGGPEDCVIDCERDGRGFTFQSVETQEAVVEGFTITKGYAGQGGAIYCTNGASPTIRDCRLINNQAVTEGGGFWCYDSRTRMSRCVISFNTARDGGAVWTLAGAPVFANCLFVNNSAQEEGGAFWWRDSAATIVNSTLYGNAAQIGGGIAIGSWPHVVLSVRNSILWSNRPDQIDDPWGRLHRGLVLRCGARLGGRGQHQRRPDVREFIARRPVPLSA